MHTQSSSAPGTPADALKSLLASHPDIRSLSARSGISEVTLRQIASSGAVSSYVTAVALELATDCKIDADSITTLATKGAPLYRREPARTLLRRSLQDGLSISQFLRRVGITIVDLHVFMNAEVGRSEDTKARVRTAIESLGLSAERTEPFQSTEQHTLNPEKIS